MAPPRDDDVPGLIEEALTRYPNVPKDVAYRMVNVESGGNAAARSYKGALGLGQLMPAAAREMGLVVDPDKGIDERLDPRKNIHASLGYLSKNIEHFGGDVVKGVAAYHAGRGAVERAGGVPRGGDGLSSTDDYVRKIVGKPIRQMPPPAAAVKVAAEGPQGSFEKTAALGGDFQNNADVPAEASPFTRMAQGQKIRQLGTTPLPPQPTYQPGDLLPNDLLRMPADLSSGAAADAPKPGIWDDLKNRFGYGWQQTGDDMRNLVRMGIGDDAVAAIDRFGKTLGMADIDEEKAKLDAAMSPEMAEAVKKDWWDSETNTLGPAFYDPRSWTGAIAESLPGTLLTMVPAVRMGTAVGSLAKANVLRTAAARGTISKEAATYVADRVGAEATARTAQVAGSILEGLQGGAQSSASVRDFIMRLPDDVLDQSDAFKALVQQYGGDRAAAKKQLSDDQATQAFFMAGVTTGIFGGFGDRFVSDGITKGIKGNIATRMIKGGITEGIFEEGTQGFTQAVSENLAKQKADPRVGTYDDAINQTVGGIAAGSAMGAGFGAVTGRERAPPARPSRLTRTAEGGPGPGDGGAGTRQLPPMPPMSEADAEQAMARQRAQAARDAGALRERDQPPDVPPPPGGGEGPSEAEVQARLATAAKMQDGDVGRPADGAPFKARIAALGTRKKQGLEDTHDAVELGPDAWVLRPKGQEERDAIPKQGADEVDVRQQTGDGEAVGGRDTQDQTAPRVPRAAEGQDQAPVAGADLSGISDDGLINMADRGTDATVPLHTFPIGDHDKLRGAGLVRTVEKTSSEGDKFTDEEVVTDPLWKERERRFEAGRKARKDKEAGTAVAKKEQLFVEWGGKRYAVKSLQDASDRYNEFRERAFAEAGAGARTDDILGDDPKIVDGDGKQVARISRNGKVHPVQGAEPAKKATKAPERPKSVKDKGPWDFKTTFPPIHPESRYVDDYETSEDSPKGLHDETAHDLIGQLQTLADVRDGLRTGVDPATGKEPKNDSTKAALRKRLADERKQAQQTLDGIFAEYESSFGPEATKAFRKHIVATAKGDVEKPALDEPATSPPSEEAPATKPAAEAKFKVGDTVWVTETNTRTEKKRYKVTGRDGKDHYEYRDTNVTSSHRTPNWTIEEILDDKQVRVSGKKPEDGKWVDVARVVNVSQLHRHTVTPEKAATAPASGIVNGKPPRTDATGDERLLLIACSEGKVTEKAPALKLYKGVMFDVLRKHVPEGEAKPNIAIVSAKHGILFEDEEVEPYDEKLTPQKADQLIKDGVPDNVEFAKPIKDVFIAGSMEYQRVARQYVKQMQAAGMIEPDASINATSGGIGEQRGQLGEYLRTIGAMDEAAAGEEAPAAKQGELTPDAAEALPDAREVEGASDAEVAKIAEEFDQAEASDEEGEGQIHHLFEPPEKNEVVRLADKVKVYHAKHGWMTPAEAKAKIAEWKAHAKAQGKTGANSEKVVLSLFDRTGEWAKPWHEAGYDVHTFDIQNDAEQGDVKAFSVEFFNDWYSAFEGKDVHAILAACPCTDFAVSGARHFAAKDADGRTHSSVELVHQTLATIEFFKPSVWAIENPVGRIEKLTGLPPWRLSFDPFHVGHPYTKKTLLWGRFDADLPIAPVEPVEGSKMHTQFGGKSDKTKNARSETPEGFAYSFFMQNNAVDHPEMAIANKYDRLDPKAIKAALAVGMTEEEISHEVDDFYYQDLDDEAANKALYDAASKKNGENGGLTPKGDDETPPKFAAYKGDRAAYFRDRVLWNLGPRRHGERLTIERLAGIEGDPEKKGHGVPEDEIRAAVEKLVADGKIVKDGRSYQLASKTPPAKKGKAKPEKPAKEKKETAAQRRERERQAASEAHDRAEEAKLASYDGTPWEKNREFSVKLEDGRKVKVEYRGPRDAIGMGVQFAFHGEAVSETGFHSDMPHFETVDKFESPEQYAQARAEDMAVATEKATKKKHAERVKALKNFPVGQRVTSYGWRYGVVKSHTDDMLVNVEWDNAEVPLLNKPYRSTDEGPQEPTRLQHAKEGERLELTDSRLEWNRRDPLVNLEHVVEEYMDEPDSPLKAALMRADKAMQKGNTDIAVEQIKLAEEQARKRGTEPGMLGVAETLKRASELRKHIAGRVKNEPPRRYDSPVAHQADGKRDWPVDRIRAIRDANKDDEDLVEVLNDAIEFIGKGFHSKAADRLGFATLDIKDPAHVAEVKAMLNLPRVGEKEGEEPEKRYEYVTKLKGDNDSQLEIDAKNLVVDAMNGDLPVDELVDKLLETGLPSGTLLAITQRLDERISPAQQQRLIHGTPRAVSTPDTKPETIKAGGDGVAAAPDAPPALTVGHTLIGKNASGNDLFEDENGVRSYLLDGTRMTENVALVPTREGYRVAKPMPERRLAAYKTVEELRGPQDEAATTAAAAGGFELDPKGKRIWKEGDRVVIKGRSPEDPFAGRHGVISKVTKTRWVTVFGGGEQGIDYSYEVRSDHGAETFGNSDSFEAETGAAPSAVPDVKDGARFTTPTDYERSIGYAKATITKYQGNLARAKKPAMKAQWAKEVKGAQEDLAHKVAVFDKWKADNPGALPAEKAATSAAPAPADTATMSLVSTVDKTGKPIQVVVLKQRVERDEFVRLRDLATKHGGYWYGKSRTPGFTFKTREGALAFMGVEAPAAPAPVPAAVRGSGEDWWKALTAFGKGVLLKEIGSKLGPGVLWEKLEPEEQAALLAQRPRAPELFDRARATEGLPPEGTLPKAAPTAPPPTAPAAPVYGTKNTVFTADAAAIAREILRKKLGNLNAGIDPEIMQAGLTLAGYHIEAGARAFGDFAKAMVADLGEVAIPYLRSWYEAVRYYPGFDAKGMTATNEIDVPPPPAPPGTLPAPASGPTVEKETPDGADPEQGTGGEDRPAGDDGSRPGDVPQPQGVRRPRFGGRGAGSGVRQSDRGSGQPGDGAGGGKAAPGGRGTGTGRGRLAAGSRRGSAGASDRVPRKRKPALPDGVADHHPDPGAIERTGSWLDQAALNLDIIELVKKLETEGRYATPEEQVTLAKWTGWGASELSSNLFRGWTNYEGKFQFEKHAGTPTWIKLRERAEALLSPDEVDAARRSTQYAHYTSEPVVRGIWKAVERLGFTGGKILEPGMGTGLFPVLSSRELLDASAYTGVEFEPFTAKIAKYLLPEQTVINGDFTALRMPAGFFDLAIGNPPFARTKILADPEYKRYRFSLHDYFFAKTIDRVRPGGLMAFVTSRYSMDKADDAARKYLAERADLISAIRLPRTAFLQNAGTEVVTDILFFQRRAPGTEPNGVKWAKLEEITTPEGQTYPINEYFVAHPENVLGTHSNQGKMRAENEYTVLPHDEGELADQLAAVVAKLPKDIVTDPPVVKVERETFARDMDPKAKKEGSIYVGDDGEVYRREYGTGRRIEELRKGGAKEREWFKGYVKLRDALKQARYDQLTEGDWEKSHAALKREYKAFVKEQGHILEFTETEKVVKDDDGEERTEVTRRYVHAKKTAYDAEGALVWMLEAVDGDGNIVEGNFLKGRVLAPPEPPQIKTVQDALAVSLSDRGHLDLPHIAELIDKTLEEVITELGDALYYTPSGEWQTDDEYLSGNVVDKLAEAKIAAESDTAYERNVQALLKVQPAPLGAKDINVGLGSPWVPLEYINAFAQDVIGIGNADITRDSITGTWHGLDGPRSQSGRNPGGEWSTDKRSPSELLDAALNAKSIKITYEVKTDTGKTTETDAAGSAAANEKVRKIREEFQRWIWRDAKRTTELLHLYNTKYNNLAPREFDGSHLRLPGLSLRYKLFKHQRQAIWRVIQTGNTYLAHAVGAGKTLEMIVSGMEQKRLGMIRTPMYVVPNHMLQQFASEFLDAYPAGDVMVADEQNFTKENRQRFVAQAAMNKPDAIVITHSAFGKIRPDPKAAAMVLDRMVTEFQTVLKELEKDKSPAGRRTRKQIEQRIEQMEQRFGSKTGGGDDVLTLNEMGVDFLYVDEAHEFRKLDFVTNRTNVKGITPEGSRRALDLYIKIKSLSAVKPGRSHVLASGTAITNTLAELYSIQRYMNEDVLDEDDMRAFDSWASQYGEVQSFDERNAAGKYEVVERFASFVNVPELMSRIRSFMDVLTSSQLKHLVKVPAMKSGGPQVVVTPPSPALKEYMQQLAHRIEHSRNWKPSPGQKGNPDPLINIITDARLASIDMGFVTGKSDPTSKLNEMLDRIVTIAKETKGNVYYDEKSKDAEGKYTKADPVKGATQIVFSAVGFGEAAATTRGFDVRGHMMKRLTAGGLKHDEIAWIADYDTAAKKEGLFRQMREGRVRVLIGSPKNMGTGVNVQKRLIAQHYLSPPWFPADEEQPRGRIVRQGNQNDEVDVLWYATKETYDSTQWQMIARKSRFIESAMMGGRDARKIEDVSEASQYEQASALASGDERVIQYTRLKRDIESLELLQRAHADEQYHLQSEMRYAHSLVRSLEGAVEKNKALIAAGAGKYVTSSMIDGDIKGTKVRGSKELGEAVLQEVRRMTAVSPPTDPKRPRELDLGTLNGAKLVGELIVRERYNKDEKLMYGARLNLRFGELDAEEMQTVIDPTREYSSAETVALGNAIAGAFHEPQADLDRAQQRITETKDRIVAGELRMGAPFDRMGELVEKVAEAARLRDELLKTGDSVPQAQEEAFANAIELGRWEGEGGLPATYSVQEMLDRPVPRAGEAPDGGVQFADNPMGWGQAETTSSSPAERVTKAQTGDGVVLKDAQSEEDAEVLRESIEARARRADPGARVPAGIFQPVRLSHHSALEYVANEWGKRLIGIKVTDPAWKFFAGVSGPQHDAIYIVDGIARPHLTILGHELVHDLARDYPELYKRFRDAILPLMRENWRKHHGDDAAKVAWGSHNEAKYIEEFLADTNGDAMLTRRYWERLGKTNPNLLRRVRDAMLVLIDKIKRAIGMGGNYPSRVRDYLTDFDKAVDIAADVMAEYAQMRRGGHPDVTAPLEFAAKSGPTWRSALRDTLGKAPYAKDGSIEAAQLGRWIDARQRDGAFKKDEVEAVKIKEWLEGQKRVTREALDAFMRDQGVKVTETMLGGKAPAKNAQTGNAQADAQSLIVQLTALGWQPDIDPVDNTLIGVTNMRDGRNIDLHEMANGQMEWRDISTQEPATSDVFPGNVFDLANQLGEALETANAEQEGSSDGGTQYGSWQLPGGENYRELLLHLPKMDDAEALAILGEPEEMTNEQLAQETGSDPLDFDIFDAGLTFRPKIPGAPSVYIVRLKDGRYYVPTPDGDYTYDTLDQAKRRLVKFLRDEGFFKEGRGFHTSHWTQANILAHVRFNERTTAEALEEARAEDRRAVAAGEKPPSSFAAKKGKRVLFIEEIQSDWAQQGRKRGFAAENKQDELKKLSKELNDWYDTQGLEHRSADEWGGDDLDKLTEEQFSYLQDFQERWNAAENDSDVPSGPFVKKTEAWVALAVKRMLRYAADNGFDAIAFTNGEQQADRYSLSKHVESIKWRSTRMGVPEGEAREVEMTLKSGERPLKMRVDPDGTIRNSNWARLEGKPLEEAVGKDVAQKIAESAEGQLEGLALDIGGKGMRDFYNKLLPNVVNDVLKKNGGGKMGTVKIAVPTEQENRYFGERQFDPADASVVERGDVYQVWANGVLHGGNFESRREAQAFAASGGKRPQLEQPGFYLTDAHRDAVSEGVPMFAPDDTRRFAPKAPPTDSEAFKRWFRESKVVDANGKPLAVYHGTGDDVRRFDREKAGKASGHPTATAGFYFSTSPDVANEFAAPKWDMTKWPHRKAHASGANVVKAHLSIQKPKEISAREFLKRFVRGNEDFEAWIMRGEHDGAVIRADPALAESMGGAEYGADTWIALTPTQIKSAISNRGTYSLANPNIDFAPNDGFVQERLVERDPRRRWGRAIGNRVRDTLTASPDTFNWWHKGPGTQYHKATISPEYARVFNIAEKFNEDSTAFARDPSERAPRLLPPLESFKDVTRDLFGRGAAKAKDVTAVSKALFEGTLNKQRDPPATLNPEQRKLFDEARQAIDRSIDILAASTASALTRRLPRFPRVARALGKISPDAAPRIYQNALEAMQKVLVRRIDKVEAAKKAQLDALDKRVEKARKATKTGEVGGRAALLYQAQEDALAIEQRYEALLNHLQGRLDVIEDAMRKVERTFTRAMKLKDEGYVPLMRFGRYTITVRDPNAEEGEDPVKWYSMHESKADALAMRRKLAESGQFKDLPISFNTVSQEEWRLFEGISPDALALFADVTELSDDPIMQKYLQLVVSNRDAMKRMIRRKGTAGYDEDIRRVLSSFLLSNARLSSRNYHFGDMLEAAQQTRGDVKDEATKLVKYVQNPQEEAGALRGLLFMNFLGGSVASALVNMTQPITMSLPYLAQYGGAGKATSALLDGMKIATGVNKPTGDLKVAMDRAAEEGLTEPHEIHQLQAEAQRNIGSSVHWRRLTKAWGMMFALAEAFNRKATFAAAYNMAKDMTKAELAKAGADSAYAFAERAVQDTQGIYSKANRPNWARGPLGATLMTFKQFSVAYLEFLKRLPPKQRALALAILIVSAGLQGLPFAEDLEDMIDTLGQSLGYRTNSKRALRRLAVSILGEDLGPMLTQGTSAIPGFPIDVSSRMGLGNLIPGSAILKRSETDKTGDVAEAVGPVGGLAKTVGAGASALLTGDVGGALKAAAPVAMQNAIKAMDMWQTGMYRDTQGRKIADTTAADAAFKMLGLQPRTVADRQRGAREAQQDVSLVKDVEADIAATWASGVFEKDPKKIDKAREDLRDWNKKNPDFPIRVSMQQIQQRVKAMRSERSDRLIKAAPKEVRRTLTEELEQ